MHKEVFNLDCASDIPQDLHIDGFDVQALDGHTVQVAIEKGQDLAEVFSVLHQRDIAVVSMRNEANRLEQMFVNLLEQPA